MSVLRKLLWPALLLALLVNMVLLGARIHQARAVSPPPPFIIANNPGGGVAAYDRKAVERILSNLQIRDQIDRQYVRSWTDLATMRDKRVDAVLRYHSAKVNELATTLK